MLQCSLTGPQSRAEASVTERGGKKVHEEEGGRENGGKEKSNRDTVALVPIPTGEMQSQSEIR